MKLQLARLRTSLDALQERFEKMNGEHTSLDRSHRDMQSTLGQLVVYSSCETSTNVAHFRTVSGKDSEIAQLKKQLQEALTEAHTNAKHIAVLEATHEDQQVTVANAEREAATLKSTVKELRDALNDARASLADVQHAFDECKLALHGELDQLRRQLGSERGAAAQHASDMKQRCDSLQAELARLTHGLSSRSLDLSSLITSVERDTLNAMLVQLKSEHGHVAAAQSQLNDELYTSLKAQAALRHKLDESEWAVTKLQRELAVNHEELQRSLSVKSQLQVTRRVFEYT